MRVMRYMIQTISLSYLTLIPKPHLRDYVNPVHGIKNPNLKILLSELGLYSFLYSIISFPGVDVGVSHRTLICG